MVRADQVRQGLEVSAREGLGVIQTLEGPANLGSKRTPLRGAVSKLSCLFCVVGVKQKSDTPSSSNMVGNVMTPSNSCNESGKDVDSPTGVDEFGVGNPDQILSPHHCHQPINAEWAAVLRYELLEPHIPESIFCGKAENVSADTRPTRCVEGLPWVKSPQRPGRYSGEATSTNIPHGRGVLKFENGDVYEGLFKNGHMHDQKGTYTWESGSVYVGGFSRGLRNGHGEHSVDGSLRYVGGFEQGIPHGFGVGYTSDGRLYHKGQWEQGIPAHAMLELVKPGSSIDDASELSDLIRAACDFSMMSSVADPRVSRYDPLRRFLGSSLGDTCSVDSDRESCLSEITTDAALKSDYDTDLDSSRRMKATSMYDMEESILTLGPRSPLTANQLKKHDKATIKATRLLNEQQGQALLGFNHTSPAHLYGPRLEI